MLTQIRLAVADDLSKIKAIVDMSFPRFFRYFAWHSVCDKSEPTLVYESDGTIIGFTKLIEFNVRGSKYGCILWIAVHPSFRLRGIASELTEAGVEYFKAHGVGAVFASVLRHNSCSLATLCEAGFLRVGVFGLWRLFGWSIFGFYRAIWFAPGEIVLMRKLDFEC